MVGYIIIIFIIIVHYQHLNKSTIYILCILKCIMNRYSETQTDITIFSSLEYKILHINVLEYLVLQYNKKKEIFRKNKKYIAIIFISFEFFHIFYYKLNTNNTQLLQISLVYKCIQKYFKGRKSPVSNSISYNVHTYDYKF